MCVRVDIIDVLKENKHFDFMSVWKIQRCLYGLILPMVCMMYVLYFNPHPTVHFQ